MDQTMRVTPAFAACLVAGFWGANLVQETLPQAVRNVLDAHYPGWRFATVSAALRRGWSSGISAAWVSGDFDGNGQRDYAVQLIQTGVPADSQQRLVAVLRRAKRYQPLLIQAGPASQTTYLAPRRKGTRLVDLEAGDDLDSSSTGDNVVLRQDGFDVLFGEEAGLTCYYAAPRFRCVVSGD
jgi:hypothetical protein